MKLQSHLNKMRGVTTHTSGFSLHNQSMGQQSEAESVRTQLMDLNQELESEQKRTQDIISKQNEELEEAKKKADEGRD